jgi:hypothetical protein
MVPQGGMQAEFAERRDIEHGWRQQFVARSLGLPPQSNQPNCVTDIFEYRGKRAGDNNRVTTVLLDLVAKQISIERLVQCEVTAGQQPWTKRHRQPGE